MLLHEQVLPLNADCAEFCPLDSHEQLLAVGSYQLDEASQERHGRLHLFTIGGSLKDVEVAEQAALDTSGIFNMRWLRHAPILALACASGEVSLVNCSQQIDHEGILEVAASDLIFPESMAVSIAVDTRHPDRLCTTSASGHAAILKITESSVLAQRSWKAHDLEAWNCEFDAWQDDTIYTGGDDCAFKGWDLRTASENPIFCNRRTHGAGVCCISSSPHKEHLLVTGSYDESLRLWDSRKITVPVREVSMGGGVWNARWHPSRPSRIVASCMQNGFAVVYCGDDSMEVEYEYPHQKSLGYGADWSHQKNLPVIASVSFYDKLLHIWRQNRQKLAT